MAEWVAPARVLPKIEEVKSNLRRWRPLDWVLFWGVIPALLLLIYALPQVVRDDWFTLDTVSPWRIQTWFLSSYTHSQLYPHLAGNLAFYFVVLLMIFAFEENRRRFWILASWSFLAVPFLSSLLTILFWGVLGRTTTGQGFSAIIGALLAYAMFIFVVWGIGEKLEVLDKPELFTGSRARYVVVKALLAVILALIVVMGLQMGIFMDVGGQVSNGIAHFGGFITSLTLLLVFDLRYEKRRYLDTMLAAAILVGIFWYGLYLARLVKVVTGG
ncbi:MAG: hypothetical protein LUO96_02640 [Methanomicrobiales archaeon]|nr:hypothetical protein [Methanomicrobiales archaeon]